ncbi:hypothetical protein BDR07DRAFT_1291397 [Suillus spraguei]|nr:hypothetical protein BDR07DRAFT_1291397 [Suillus spraguei]
MWLAIFTQFILAYIYVNDSFSYAEAQDQIFYDKYQKLLPHNMVQLLQLWDVLGIPHEEWKQVFGSPLPVIGFDIDAQLMRITLREQSKVDLVSELQIFAHHCHRRMLRECEHIAGSLNCALNVTLVTVVCAPIHSPFYSRISRDMELIAWTLPLPSDIT